jgi:hypothetical protein
VDGYWAPRGFDTTEGAALGMLWAIAQEEGLVSAEAQEYYDTLVSNGPALSAADASALRAALRSIPMKGIDEEALTVRAVRDQSSVDGTFTADLDGDLNVQLVVPAYDHSFSEPVLRYTSPTGGTTGFTLSDDELATVRAKLEAFARQNPSPAVTALIERLAKFE